MNGVIAASQEQRDAVPPRRRTFRGSLGTVRRHVTGFPVMPSRWLPSLEAAWVLWTDYAHLRSVRTRTAVDRQGAPLPWYTYPAIEYLRQLDFRDRTVFEFGSGNSTLFWARVARSVVSVEDDPDWFALVRSKAPSNATILLESDLKEFSLALQRRGTQYDVIVVDGPARGRTRLRCVYEAITALRSGGLIILDNSDWLPESSRVLRDHGLLQVDMTGFAPICAHVQTTSLFFDRSFAVRPLTGRLPMPGTGALPHNWERPLAAGPGEVVQVDAEAFGGAADVTPFSFETADGVRSFKAFTYLGGDDTRCIGVVDLDLRRTLLARHAPGNAAEIRKIVGLPWTQFRAFVNRHPMKRYPL